jgi:hypothetical protein
METPSRSAAVVLCLSAAFLCRKFCSFPVLAGLVRTFPLALAFAGLLQSSSAAAQQAITPASQATTTAGQETKQGVEGILATIIQSRSTNTRARKIVIHNDGSATAAIAFPLPNAGFQTVPLPNLDN